MEKLIPHMLVIDYGHLRRRLQPCGRYACKVHTDWIADCVQVACGDCGAGPPTLTFPIHGPTWWCEVCGATRRLAMMGVPTHNEGGEVNG